MTNRLSSNRKKKPPQEYKGFDLVDWIVRRWHLDEPSKDANDGQ